MAKDKYSLDDIQYESWNDVFDQFNEIKRKHPSLTFDIWYSQQRNYITLKDKQNGEKDIYLKQHEKQIQQEIDAENENYDTESVLNILQDLFKSIKKIEIYDEIDDNLWLDNDEEDEEDPPF